MKSIAVLLVSVIVVGLILRYCFLPPYRMPDYVVGDGKCDVCGRRAVYKLRFEYGYLRGEYCSTHRWLGVIRSDPLSKVLKVLLGAALFGIIYSAVSLLAGSKGRELNGGLDSELRT